MTTTTAEADLSVPDAAAAIGVKVDRLRHLLRENPDVAALFRRAGPYRVIAPKLLETLRSLVATSRRTSERRAPSPAG